MVHWATLKEVTTWNGKQNKLFPSWPSSFYLKRTLRPEPEIRAVAPWPRGPVALMIVRCYNTKTAEQQKELRRDLEALSGSLSFK